MIVCYLCEENHHLSKCTYHIKEIHNLLLKKFVEVKKRFILARRHFRAPTPEQIIAALSIHQMKRLLKVYYQMSRRQLRKKVFMKYDALSNNLFRFHVDYPSYESILESPITLPQDQLRIRHELERQLTYLIFEISLLESREFIFFVRNLPNYFQRFVNERLENYPLIEPSTPPYHPPNDVTIECITASELLQCNYECAICQEECDPYTKVTFNCHHFYCVGCIQNFTQHINLKPRCPLCRTDVETMIFAAEDNEKKIKGLLIN